MMRDTLIRPARISAADARTMTEQGQAVLVDVRTPEEYAMGHIPGAMLLTLDKLPQQAVTSLPDKDASIIVYCQSGGRSAFAASHLSARGYKHVYDLGGIFGWPYGITR